MISSDNNYLLTSSCAFPVLSRVQQPQYSSNLACAMWQGNLAVQAREKSPESSSSSS